ncbi:MAG: DUF4260 domain-containing protein [Chloroflexota bacterium]|nr:DUF4260 domain-containing protein [Chloroflexota bacterium]
MTAAANGHVEGAPRRWLQLEGAAGLIAGLWVYGAVGGNWLLAVPLLLLPDISMVGYLRDPRLGALTYNVVHNWAVALAVLGGGVLLSAVPLELAGAILIAHVGGDRLLGYGLKYPTAFGDTHLGRIGRRR